MDQHETGNKIDILLVEDDEFDAKLTQRFLKKEEINYNLSIVRDGEAAWAFLQKKEPHQNVKTPDVIILDMGLPKMNGQDVLDRLKADSKLHKIPVIVLTGQELGGTRSTISDCTNTPISANGCRWMILKL